MSDFNNPTRQGRIGVGYYDFNIDGGVRDSAARRFLAPLIARSTVSSKQRPSQRRAGRFTLNMHAEVDRILLQDTAGSPRAVGVEYTEDGVKQRAYLNTASRGESTVKDSFGVIVSAGAILTPKLLLRSGIGPKEDLEHIGIPVKKHLPMVGKHLQDHPVVGLTLKVDPALAAGEDKMYWWCRRLRNMHGVCGQAIRVPTPWPRTGTITYRPWRGVVLRHQAATNLHPWLPLPLESWAVQVLPLEDS